VDCAGRCHGLRTGRGQRGNGLVSTPEPSRSPVSRRHPLQRGQRQDTSIVTGDTPTSDARQRPMCVPSRRGRTHPREGREWRVSRRGTRLTVSPLRRPGTAACDAPHGDGVSGGVEDAAVTRCRVSVPYDEARPSRTRLSDSATRARPAVRRASARSETHLGLTRRGLLAVGTLARSPGKPSHSAVLLRGRGFSAHVSARVSLFHSLRASTHLNCACLNACVHQHRPSYDSSSSTSSSSASASSSTAAAAAAPLPPFPA
jgi:hypothetical protein